MTARRRHIYHGDVGGQCVGVRSSREPLMRAIVVPLFLGLAFAGCSDNKQAGVPTGRSLGANSGVGNGTVSSYAEFEKDGAPKAIGIVFSASALEGLPSEHSDGHHCFDRNNDGTIDLKEECFGSHEWVIPLPSETARRVDIPFKWVGLNWNPHGHIPPGVYNLPHFDIHFYIEPIEKIFAIAPGTCGPEFVRCDQFKVATKPLPSNYMHPDYKSVDAVAPAMGNHLIDLTSPEFNKIKFTRSWIYGAYDGRVTFYEEMVTRDYLLGRPTTCFPLKSPPAVGVRGYYPAQSCIRHISQANEYTVSMEGFVLREVSAPEPPRAER
jgi:hypothetical protein